MPTGNTIVPDAQVLSGLNALQATSDWTSGMLARLFQNNISPTPADTVGSFVEATYSGYGAQAVGAFGSPVQIVPGQYASTSGVLTFPAISAGSQTLYGVYVTFNGSGQLALSWAFSTPITISAGDPSILVQIVYEQWAAILI